MPSVHCGFNNIPGGATGSVLLSGLGPTLIVDIGFDPAWVFGGAPPAAGLRGLGALVDTGAGESCIDSLLATQLNLPIVDRRRMSGANGPMEVNMHLAQVYVPSLSHTIYGVFAGVHLQAGGQPHHALIGRTFLQSHILSYNGITGVVTIEKP